MSIDVAHSRHLPFRASPDHRSVKTPDHSGFIQGISRTFDGLLENAILVSVNLEVNS